MTTAVARFTSEVKYLKELARMYQGNGETDVSRSALVAAQAIEELIDNLIGEQAADTKNP